MRPFDFVAKDRSTNMDGIKSEPDIVFASEKMALAERWSRLGQVLSNLEHNSAILETLELTLAVALLDHAIAEVRRHIVT